jgi:xylulokinase
MSAPLVFGVDVGSQGTCAQALEPDGTLVATTRWAHSLSYPRPGWAEQESVEWSDALVRVLSELRERCAGREIAALSFGSQLDGLVACDADGVPLRPALIWCDRRAGDVCSALDVDVDALRALTGCNLDPGHVGPKIVWLARHEPDVFGAAAVFALPGAWMAWRASGVLAVDPSNASSTGLLDPRTRGWAVDACAALDVDVARLPQVLPAHSVLGPVAPRPGCRRRRRWSWVAATRWRRRSGRESSSRASCAT